jgi:hypothetical protein
MAEIRNGGRACRHAGRGRLTREAHGPAARAGGAGAPPRGAPRPGGGGGGGGTSDGTPGHMTADRWGPTGRDPLVCDKGQAQAWARTHAD